MRAIASCRSSIEILDHYEPDLIVVCTGHNEFLEDRTYRHVRRLPVPVRRFLGPISRSRTFTSSASSRREPGSRSVDPSRPLPPQVETILDFEGGLEAYHRDDAWTAAVLAHFEANLRRMAALTDRAGVPLLFVNPDADLRSSPVQVGAPRRVVVRRACPLRCSPGTRPDRSITRDLPAALRVLRRAEADRRPARRALASIGMCLGSLADPSRPERPSSGAKDLDVCPLRITEPLRAIVATVARQTDTPVIDIRTIDRPDRPTSTTCTRRSKDTSRSPRRFLTGWSPGAGCPDATAGGPSDTRWSPITSNRCRHPTFSRGNGVLQALADWASGRGFRPEPDKPSEPAPNQARSRLDDSTSSR